MPSWKDLRRFCVNDGWELYKATDHDYFRKYDANGNIRQTRVSRNPGEIYGTLWNEILKKQLQVPIEYFNSKI